MADLARSCKKANIEYKHCGELGNKTVPISVLIETERGQNALAGLANDFDNSGWKATAIMCAERSSLKCHRYVVSHRLLEDFGVNVTHINYDGNLDEHVKIDLQQTGKATL